MSVSQSVARPVRTATQLGASAVVVEFADAFFFEFSTRQYAAALGLLTLVFGFVQVVVENRYGKAFLRVPEPPARPVDVVEEAAPEPGYVGTSNLHDPPPGVVDYDPKHDRAAGPTEHGDGYTSGVGKRD